MQVLLIYDLIPENTKIYLLTPDEETFQKLKKCHGNFGNACEQDAETDQLVNEWLPLFLEKITPIYDCSEKQETMHFNGEIEIIHTGFYL